MNNNRILTKRINDIRLFSVDVSGKLRNKDEVVNFIDVNAVNRDGTVQDEDNLELKVQKISDFLNDPPKGLELDLIIPVIGEASFKENFKGMWEANYYSVGNVVYHSGSFYECIFNRTSDHINDPTADREDTDHNELAWKPIEITSITNNKILDFYCSSPINSITTEAYGKPNTIYEIQLQYSSTTEPCLESVIYIKVI